MHFQLGATNSEIPPLGIAGTRRQAADYRMPIQHLMGALNQPSSSSQFFNQSGHGGGSERETLIKFPPTDVAQIDDLSAVVTKRTNPANVFADLYPYSSFNPRSGGRSVNSIPDICLQDSIHRDNNDRARSMHHKNGDKAVQPMPQFPSNQCKGYAEDAEDFKYRPLERNRCSVPGMIGGVSEREIHILSERQRRSGMNQLLSKMRSMLPDQTIKSDKISIVAETINYIHYLQQRLHTRSKKLPCGADTAGSSHQTGPSTADTILSTTGSSGHNAILPEISLKSHAGKDLYITIKCAKKGNLLPSIILIMEEHNLEVMDAFVSTNDRVAFHSLHLKVLQTLDAAGTKALTDTLHLLIKSEHQISLEKRH